MKLELAREINKEFFPHTLDILNQYVAYKISQLHKHLEKSNTIEETKFIQGKIQALKDVRRIREDAVGILENKGN